MENLKDITLTLDGDLVFGSNGDLVWSSGYDVVAREFNKAIRTVNPSWRTHKSIGAGVEQFLGRENLPGTARDVETELSASLYGLGLLKPGERLSVDLVPVSLEEVRIYVGVQTAGGSRDILHLIMSFEGGVQGYIPDPNVPKVETITRKGHERNKYLKRLHERV